MKKTIAKIMAAAVALSTVVAPNVNAGTSYNAAVAAGAPVQLKSLDLSQTAATLTGNLNGHSLIGTTSETIGSRNNPVDAGFTVNTNAAGQVISVDSDLYVTATARGLDGDLLFYDGNDIFLETGDAVTAVSAKNFKDGTGSEAVTGTTAVRKYTTDNLKTNYGYTGTAYDMVQAIANGDVKVTDVNNANFVTSQKSADYLSNSVLKKTIANGIFDVDQYIGKTVFDGGYQLLANGQIRFLIDTPNATKTAQVYAAASSESPIVLQMTMKFGDTIRNAKDEQVATKYVWVRLASQEAADYDGYVILHEDNGNDRHIGVNYTVDGSGYATITKANTSVLNSDVAKGGRLYLDYVYNRTNTNASVTSNLTYKIRTIGSRVFKEGKFQAISGSDGDGGAKWIRNIHNGAFRKCKQLKKVNLGTSKKIRKINSKAFYDCKKLATVRMDARNLKNVGSDAFKNCKSNITFKLKGSTSQVNKAWAKIKKQAPKKAKKSKI